MSNFEKKRVLGHGSQATVHEAYDEDLDRSVAIKEISPQLWDDEAWQAEARKMAAISHPHVLTVHSVDPETKSLILELADRGTLRDLMAAGPVQPAKVRRILRQVLSGLAEIHRHNLIHRDIKPENILSVRDTFKIGDFGVAGQTVGGATGDELDRTIPMAAPRYVAPEALSSTPGPRPSSDLYSLGLVAYELLVGPRELEEAAREIVESEGESPASGFDLWLRFQRSPMELPPPAELDPTVPEDLSRVVAGMVRKDVDPRYKSAEEVLRELGPEEGEGGAPWSADGRAPTAPHPIVEAPGLSRPLKWTVLVVLVLAGAFAGLWLVGRQPTAEIMVTSEPAGAEVFHEGQGLGETPVRINAPVGTELVLRKNGFLDHPLTYAEPEDDELHGKLVPALVTIDSTPPGATVSIAGEELGQTPLEVDWSTLSEEGIEDGRVAAMLDLEGYRSLELELEPGAERLETLERIPFRREAVADAVALAEELGRFVGPGDDFAVRPEGRRADGVPRVSLGEPLRFVVEAEEPAYLVLFVLSSDGSIACLYPNSQHPRLEIEPGEILLPLAADRQEGFELRAGRPLGRDQVYLLATSEPKGPLPASGQRGTWLTYYAFEGETKGGPAGEFAAWVAEAVTRAPRENHLARTVVHVVEPGEEDGS